MVVEENSNFSTLDSGLRDETPLMCLDNHCLANFSTLDSGLRDETVRLAPYAHVPYTFQYPRLGSTR